MILLGQSHILLDLEYTDKLLFFPLKEEYNNFQL
jgi:hypothetical protein